MTLPLTHPLFLTHLRFRADLQIRLARSSRCAPQQRQTFSLPPPLFHPPSEDGTPTPTPTENVTEASHQHLACWARHRRDPGRRRASKKLTDDLFKSIPFENTARWAPKLHPLSLHSAADLESSRCRSPWSGNRGVSADAKLSVALLWQFASHSKATPNKFG